MSKGSSKVRAADSQGGYIYIHMYICSRFKGKKKIFFSLSFFLSGSLVGSVHAGPLCVLQQQRALWISVEERRDPAPEIQYSRSNSKRKIPTVSLSHNATVAATGFRAYERYASRQKSTRERARERASERERESAREITGGVREEDELAKKKRTRQAGKRERRGQRIIY